MMVSISKLFNVLESALPNKVFRDIPPDDQEYPYLIVEFSGERNDYASNKLAQTKTIYQLAYVTEGIEKELQTIKTALKENGILHEQFIPGPYKENDQLITQFITYVRCKNEQ